MSETFPPAAPSPYAPEFLLPGVDDDPLTEAGVILLGLDARRLLAGLAVAARADDPGQIALAVDYARHGREAEAAFTDLVDEGLTLWREFTGRTDLDDGSPSGSVRETWAFALRAVGDDPAAGPATRAYRAACLLRREDIDALRDRNGVRA